MASNADYTFQQVMNGIGSYNEAGNTGFWSEGVEQMQEYLTEIGYTIEDTFGFFLKNTTEAVKKFQFDCGISVDGDAGRDTCTRLYAVHSSEYFRNYGWPLTDSQWGTANILAGKFNNVDLLARIIIAESGYHNIEDEKGVALVIKNRVDNPSYHASQVLYPDASVYARVIGKKVGDNPEYTTTIPGTLGSQTAQCPRRGFQARKEDGYINQAWKKAVDLADDIVKNRLITVTGYEVNGLNIMNSSTMTVNSTDNKQYLNQQSLETYKKTYNAGNVSAAVQPLTFSTSNEESSNVIFKWR